MPDPAESTTPWEAEKEITLEFASLLRYLCSDEIDGEQLYSAYNRFKPDLFTLYVMHQGSPPGGLMDEAIQRAVIMSIFAFREIDEFPYEDEWEILHGFVMMREEVEAAIEIGSQTAIADKAVDDAIHIMRPFEKALRESLQTGGYTVPVLAHTAERTAGNP
jgi:hypothetical protein